MATKDKQFNYTARNARGEVMSGQISAETESGAALRLHAMGLAPITVRPESSAKKMANINIGPKKRVKAKDMAVFTRQLTTLVEAGLPLVRCVQAMTEQTTHPTLQEALPEVQDQLEQGVAFSQALAQQPKVFPPLMVSMVASGEASGSLGQSLQAVADAYAKEARLKAKVKGAMIYPGIVISLAAVLVTGMLLFVVPTFSEIFADLGGELPLPTRILIATSNGLRLIIPGIAVLAVIFLIWWGRNKNKRKVREKVDPLKLRVPIFGKFFLKIALARFSRGFANLLSAGVPLVQTLDIVTNTSGNIVIGDATQAVRKSVIEGKGISSTLAQQAIFPPLLSQMVTTGEETGAIPEMLERVATFYEEEVDAAADALSATLEPVLIIGMGGLIGAQVIALYMPIFSVFDLVG